MKRRTLVELLERAAIELQMNPVLSYVMVDGQAVYPEWCVVCRGFRAHDVLRDGHPAIPDFRICVRCGNGVAIEKGLVAA